jgi:hypothetical protein
MHDNAYAHDLQMLNAYVTPGCYNSKVPYKILQEEKYGRHYLFKFLALRYSVPSNYEAFGFSSVLYVDVILLYLLNTPFNAHAYFL